ncbi:MAG: hypothetical protein WC697_03905 [Patescibacteria group bacterium]|jgi:hypothetical protein
MDKITRRLNDLALTDGSLKRLHKDVENYIKQASCSPLMINDKKLFMWHILAFIETANERKTEALRLVEELHPQLHTCESLENLLNAIQRDMGKITEVSLEKPQDRYLLNNIIGAVIIATGTGLLEKDVEKILEKYYPKLVEEDKNGNKKSNPSEILASLGKPTKKDRALAATVAGIPYCEKCDLIGPEHFNLQSEKPFGGGLHENKGVEKTWQCKKCKKIYTTRTTTCYVD